MQKILNIAYPICLKIPRQKKHVSLILYKKQIISVGTNSFKTHPAAKQIGYRFEELHSELDAYTKVPKELRTKSLTLVNVRFNKYRQLRMAKPCSLCLDWCSEIFTDIWFTTNEGLYKL
jgi:hypothetical protein